MRLSSGVPGFDALIQGGIPQGAAVIVQGPAGVEKDAILLQFIGEGLKQGGSALVVLSSVSTETFRKELRAAGVEVDRAIAENRLKFVDWFSYKEENVHEIEEEGPTYKASVDLANVGIAVSRAIASFPKDTELRAAVEVLSPALSFYELQNVYGFAQSTKAKLERFGFTSLFVLEKEMHDERTVSSIQQPFDGVIDIERIREGDKIVRKIAVLSLKGTRAEPQYVPLELGADNRLQVLVMTERERTLRDQENLLKTNPDDPRIWLATGRNYHGMGKDERALECVEAALILAPDDASAWRFKADVLDALGRDEEAKQSRRRATTPSRRPDSQENFPSDRAAAVDDRLGENAEDADALFAKAAMLAKGGDVPGAIRTLETLASVDGAYPGLWVLKAKLHALRGEKEQWRQAREHAQESSGRQDEPASEREAATPLVPAAAAYACPACGAGVREQDATCPLCGLVFEGGEGTVAETVPPPKTNRLAAERGLTNGLSRRPERGTGRTNGLVKGLGGRTNGLVNGTRDRSGGRTNGLVNGTRDRSGGRTNGLVNGTRDRSGGRTNGLVNGTRDRSDGRTNGLQGRTDGKTNGLVNGLGALRAGLTNGFTNGSGFTNGLGSVRFRPDAAVTRRKLYIIPLLSAALLLLPLLASPTPLSGLGPITIDGDASDWTPSLAIAQSRGGSNPNVDIVRFGIVDNMGGLAVLIEVAGTALQGGGNPPTMDAFHVFLDTDGDWATGYRVDGLGADRLIRISGWGASVNVSTVQTWDGSFDPTDWRGWIGGAGIPAAAAGPRTEAHVDWQYLEDAGRIAFATVHARGFDGSTDTADFALNVAGGSLVVRQVPVVPETITTPTTQLLRLDVSAALAATRWNALTVTLIGSAPFTTTTQIRLVDAVGSIVDTQVPAGRRVAFQFAERTVIAGATETYYIIAETLGLGGDTIGALVGSAQDVNAPGAVVSVIRLAGPSDVGYLVASPAAPRVDGGYDEWRTLGVDPSGDVTGPDRPGIDFEGFAAQSLGNESFFFVEVGGRVFGGTWVVEPNGLAMPAGVTAVDSDRDQVPDAVDPLPFDFNNDGIPDADEAGDVDKDGVMDFGGPGGTDLWLNTTIPAGFPAPHAGRAVSIYVGPVQKPLRSRDDILRVFVDRDNSSSSGYAINGLGADRMIELAGTSGAVRSSGLFSFAGTFPGQWSWLRTADTSFALGFNRTEFAAPENLTPGGSRVYVEIAEPMGARDVYDAGTRGTRGNPGFASGASSTSPASSFDTAPSPMPVVLPWADVPGTRANTLIDPRSNAITTQYNHQRKVVRAGDVAVDSACDATNSDGCWYSVFDDRAGSVESDFKDGSSVAVPTTLGLLDSMATTRTSSDNLIVAVVQFDNTAASARTISAGSLELRRGTATTDPLISETQFAVKVPATGGVGDGMFAVLIGKDPSAPGDSTYGVFAAADATGLNAEVKLVMINGLASAGSVFADGSSVALATTATVLVSQATTFPAASSSLPNIIVAAVQIDQTKGRVEIDTPLGIEVRRGSTSLRGIEYKMSITDAAAASPNGVFAMLVALDAGAAANPTYDVRAVNADATSTGNGEAKLMVFRGLAATDVDTSSVSIGTSRTVLGTSSTTFASGDDVILGSMQINSPIISRTYAAAANDIRLAGTGSGSSNEFAHTIGALAADMFVDTGSFNIGTGAAGTTVTVTTGFEPKVYFLWASRRTESTDTASTQNHKQAFGAGISTTDRRAVCGQSVDNVTSAANTAHRADAALCALFTGGGIDGLADHDAMLPTGFRLIIDDNFGFDLRVHYLAIGGSDLTNVATGMFTESATTGNQDITTVGFQPDAVVLFSAMIGADPPGLQIDSTMMIGFAAGSGNPNDVVWAGGANDAVSPTQAISYNRAGESIGLFDAAVTLTNGRGEVDAWLSNGFSLDWTERAGSRRIHYVALKGGQHAVGDVLTQTNTSQFSETGLAFSPMAGLFVSHNKAQSTSDIVQDHDEWSLGSVTDASTRRAHCVLDEDAQAISDVGTGVEHDELYCNLSTDTAIEGLMDVVSVNSDGWTLVMDDADPAAAFVGYWAIGPSSGLFVDTGSFNIGTGAAGTTVTVTTGFEPKVYFLWASRRTESTDTASTQNHKQAFGAGISTTDRRAVCGQSVDNVTSAANTAHRADAALCALFTGGGIDGLADHDAMLPTGFRLIIDDNFGFDLRVHYLAIGGSDLTNVATGMFTESATTGNQDITTVGFQPDAVVLFSAMIGADPPGLQIDSTMMIGFAAGSGNPNDVVWAGGANDAVSPTQAISYNRAGESIGLFDAAVTLTNGRGEVDAWLSNGFSLDWTERAGSRRIHYVALKGGQHAVGDVLTQTNTSQFSETGLAFSPMAGLFVSHNKAQSTSDIVQDHDEWSLGSVTDASTRRAHCVLDEDAQAISDVGTGVEHDELYCNLSTDTAIEGLMDVVSVNSDGWTLVMDDADPAAAFVGYWAIGPYLPVGASMWEPFVRKVTTASANPSYEGAATAPSTGSNGELKLVAIHLPVWDRLVLMRSSDTSGSTWGSQVILASGNTADSPLLLSRDSAEPSIAIDSAGYLHVVWVSASAAGDQNTLNLVRYTKTTVAYPTQGELANAANWEAVTNVDDASAGYMPTVSTDTSNNPHVAWSGSKTGETIYYKNKAGGAWKPTVSWGTTYTGQSVDLSPQNNYVSLARSFVGDTEAQIGYRSNTGTNTVNSPKTRPWDGSAWGGETERSTSGSPIRAVRMAYSPTIASERVIVTLSDDGWLDAYVCSPWCTVTNNIGQVWSAAPTTSQMRFDIAYEQASGEALLVYGVLSTDTTRDIAYKTYIGGSWSAEQYLDDTGHATDTEYVLIVLASRKGSNQIGLVGGDTTNADVNAWIWDGSAFGSFIEVNANAQNPIRGQAAIAWESSSGHLLAVSVDTGSTNLVSKEFTTSWGAASTPFTCADTAEVRWLSLKPNPLSTANDMMLVNVDSKPDLNQCYWDGSAWAFWNSGIGTVDTQASQTCDFAWESSGSKGLVVCADLPGLNYISFTAPNTWNTPSVAVSMGGSNTHPWIQLRTNPFPQAGDTKILGAVMEGTANDLGAIRWDGTTFTVIGTSTFSADVGTTLYESFELEYRETAASDPFTDIQYTVCKNLSTSSCDASGEFTKWDGTAGYDTVATSVESTSYASLATTYEANGDLWVAYAKDVDATTRAIFARYLDYPSGGWASAETLDSSTGVLFTKPSIGIDKDNNVHALYVRTTGPHLFYKHRTGGIWGSDTAASTETLTKGGRVSGTFSRDVALEDTTYVQYREADFLTKVSSFNVGTGAVGTTTQVTGTGFQPKAVLFWWSGLTTTVDFTGGLVHKRGFGVAVSPTDRRAVYSQSMGLADPTATDAGHHDAAAIGALTTAGAIDGLADLQSMDSNGFTLIIDDQFATNLRVHYLALGGSELTNVGSGIFTEPGATGSQNITTVGFQPDAVVLFSAMIGADPPGTAVDSTMMLGAAAGSTPVDAVWAGGSNDAAATAQTISYSRAGESIALFDSAVTLTDGRAEVSSWLSNGFQVNWLERAGSRRVHYLALKGGQYLVGDLLTEKDTVTTIVEGAFGFQPKGALLASHGTTQSTQDTVKDHDSWSLGGFTSATERAAHGTWDEHGTPTAEVTDGVEHDEVYINIATTETLEGLMDVQSVDSGGFTLIMDDADPDQFFVWYLAFGSAGGAMEIRHDFSSVPSGTTYTLKAKGYRVDEDMLVQVLTPPSAWNTRITISATTNALYTYTMTGTEYNSGAPSIRFVDASGPDPVVSDLYLDVAVVVTDRGREFVDSADQPTLMVRAPNDATYGGAAGGLYWKASASETYFFSQIVAGIPEFEAVAIPVLGILLFALWRRRRVRGTRAEDERLEAPKFAEAHIP